MLRPRSWLPAAAFLATSLLAVSPIGAETARAIDAAEAAAHFAEAEAVGRQSASLWGAPLHGPMLFVDRGTRDVVANVADPAGTLVREGPVFRGTWPAELPVYNGSVDYGGRTWTILAWPPPSRRFERRRLMAHELFHRLQAERKWPAADAANAHLESEEARLWLRLEWRALQRALGEQGDERRAAIEDALLFRAERRRRFPAGAAEERALELNEGLAEYTGVRAAIPGAARDGWVFQQLDAADAAAARSSVVRNFAYASGPAYGLLLDSVNADWRREVFATGDLGAQLAAASEIALPAEGAPEEARLRAARYDFAALAAQESAREAERQARLEAQRRRFVDGPVLALPVGETFSYSFDPNAVAAFGDDDSVLATAEIRDAWGLLRVTAGGVLLVREEGAVVRVVVPAPQSANGTSGDGWELELAEGWELRPGEREGDRVAAPRPSKP